jgi:hypothetical protein
METEFMKRKASIKSASFLALGLLGLSVTACSNASNSGSKPAEDRPLKDFSEEIKSETTTLSLKTNEQLFVPVVVKNTGTEAWSAKAATYPVHLSYLWFSAGKQLPLDTVRTFLGADLAPGAEQILKANVSVPPTPGQYTLKFMMVQERVAWFGNAGGKSLEIPVTVE